MEYKLAGGLRKAPSMWSLNSSNKRHRHETFSDGLDFKGSSVSLSSTLLIVSASGGARKEILSCVARAEPRNKLCGMTVEPRIPTARGES